MVRMFRGGYIGYNSSFFLDSIDDDHKVRLLSMHMFDKQFIVRYNKDVDWAFYVK
jgi:hypothetical protein